MLTFRQEPPPQNIDKGLANWLMRQFDNVRKAASAAVDYVYLKTTNVLPDRTKDGELRLADGDNWNPRSMGYGLYWWADDNSQWQRVFSIGAGGSVGQSTNKTTGVTLNAPTGEITMNNAALNKLTAVTFTMTNSYSKAKSVIAINHIGGGSIGDYDAHGVCSDGSVDITLYNKSAVSLSNAVRLRFTILPGATS